MEKRGYKRRKYYVHEIQKEYAVMIVILLLVYTFILSVFLFGLPAIKLFTDAPLSEKGEAATQILVFAERLWPAVVFSLILSGFLTIYITNRVAGPIYRFEQMIRKLIAGDFSDRVKLRDKDRLVEFSDLLNQLTGSINASLSDVKNETAEIKKILEQMLPDLKAKGEKGILKYAEGILEHHEKIEAALDRFRLSSLREEK